MLDDKFNDGKSISEYRQRWEDKKRFYEKNGIAEGKNLIVTEDDTSGGLDAAHIQQIIEDTFELD